MPSATISITHGTLGTMVLSCQWPLVITPPTRSVATLTNALAAEPVQGADYISDYGSIAARVRLRGVETQGETAADHLERQWSNLCAFVASDTCTFSLQMRGATAPWTARVFKSDPPVRVDDFASDAARMRFVDINLRYLDAL